MLFGVTIYSIYFQAKWTIRGIAQFSVLLVIFHTPAIITADEVNISEERSQRGMALLNHTYKSVYTETYPGCLMACMHDLRCKSFNYWWPTSQCDLNNMTKYSAGAKVFIQDISSTYMGMIRQPGIDNYKILLIKMVNSKLGDK